MSILHMSGFIDDIEQHHFSGLEILTFFEIYIALVFDDEVTSLGAHADEENVVVEFFLGLMLHFIGNENLSLLGIGCVER